MSALTMMENGHDGNDDDISANRLGCTVAAKFDDVAVDAMLRRLRSLTSCECVYKPMQSIQ